MQKRTLGSSNEENIGAAAVALTPDDLRNIADAMAKITVVGDRY